MIQPGEYPLTQQVWQDTAIELPSGAPSRWRSALTGEALEGSGKLLVGEVLQHFPVGLLLS
ncbi:MAG TPA: hypothetical protein V6D04_06370 [Candidatus Obscuribacterales bacterium]